MEPGLKGSGSVFVPEWKKGFPFGDGPCIISVYAKKRAVAPGRPGERMDAP